ncbi:MAG: TonB-dependent receptor plug domain-containing protein, partial [Sphingomonadales bacterium]
MKTRSILLTAAIVQGAALPTVPVMAQAQSFALEEIVVTARKREERLLDVPDAITAFTATAIERSGLRSVTDVSALVPNFSIVQGQQPGTEFINMRGVGQIRNGEPPVAMVIDGVQVSSGYQITQDLFDVERIEVLKGPQGSVYGRNAIGGAINIITRAPTNELEGGVRASYGTGQDWRASGHVSGAIVEDRLLVRLSGSFRDFSGDIDNVTLDEKVNFDKLKNFRARMIGHLSETVSLDLRYTRVDQKAGAAWYSFVPPGVSINQTGPVTANVLGEARRVLNDLSAKLDV